MLHELKKITFGNI